MDQWLLKTLACPRDHKALHLDGNRLICPNSHQYPVVDGTPVMLLNDVDQTLWVANASLEKATEGNDLKPETPDLYAESLGISPEARDSLHSEVPDGANIDPVVQHIIGATCGYLYAPIIKQLKSYPIPESRLPPGDGETLLDIGCNWGRWSVAAARKGYNVVGIDPSLGAVKAAQRVCTQLGVSARFVVADARYLPFAPNKFDVAFSYSVLQHFGKDDAKKALREVARVLKEEGASLIQMPNIYGLVCLYHQARRRFREGKDFEVRYWRLSELERTFKDIIGDTSLSVDGYFGLGIQKSDVGLMPLRYRLIIHTSEALRGLSKKVGIMRYVADSIYVKSTRSSQHLWVNKAA